MVDSILETVKASLGIPSSYTIFDPQIIMHINSVFSILNQLGVGTAEPFIITGSSNTWSEFLEDKTNIESVKSYVYLKVKMLFDPPTNGPAIDSINRLTNEFEWRLNVADDNQ